MATKNGTVTGVSLLSGNPEGVDGTVSSVVNRRRAYLVTASFPAYTASTDTMTLTGVCTAIAAATRNGKTLTLRAAVCAFPGIDSAGLAVFGSGASVEAETITNSTTTGDISSGKLTDAAGTDQTSAACSGVGFIAIVDEQG